MAPRLELQTLLENILGSRNVYFQPPASIRMNYPAIVYARDYSAVTHADNQPYNVVLRYQVTVIDRNPDSEIPGKIRQLPLCQFTRFFTSEDLNHDIFDLYF